jgi:hypothetical protein
VAFTQALSRPFTSQATNIVKSRGCAVVPTEALIAPLAFPKLGKDICLTSASNSDGSTPNAEAKP